MHSNYQMMKALTHERINTHLAEAQAHRLAKMAPQTSASYYFLLVRSRQFLATVTSFLSRHIGRVATQEKVQATTQTI
jgi:hypothetical protein